MRTDLQKLRQTINKLLTPIIMKRHLLFFVLLFATLSVCATDYYRINSFPIDGADIRDTFLIVVEYAGNTYIWNGQEATGKNYVCLQSYSSDVISGDYADNEVAIVHNKWHNYNKLFSVLCKGDGDRDDKGGYYLGGVKGTNGISFSSGQVDAEITFEDTEGIHIATKSGVGEFRFNITPNDPHGFKFYEHQINMLTPTLYVRGANARYAQQVEYEDMSASFTYAQADYYEDQTLREQPKVKDWDFTLASADDEDALPQLYLMLTNESDQAIGGHYVSTVSNGEPWQVYCTNSSVKSSIYTFESDKGNETSLYLKYCELSLTPLSKDSRGVYTYHIEVKWVDQNNKHRKVDVVLPVIGQRTVFTKDEPEGVSSEMFFVESDDEHTGLRNIDADEIGVSVSGGQVNGPTDMRIYSIEGRDVTGINGSLTTGCYVVRCGGYATKVMVVL